MIHLLVLLLASGVLKAEESIQPFIDELKRTELEPSNDQQNYTEKEKQKLERQSKLEEEDETPPAKDYTSTLKKENPELTESDGSKGYATDLRNHLAPEKHKSAIAELKSGQNVLKPNKEGKIQNAFGFRFTANADRKITVASQGRSFEDLYGGSFIPDLQLFFEHQFIRNPYFGNLGIVGEFGVSIAKGQGEFAVPLSNYGSETDTVFRFVTIPLSLAARYTFTLGNLLQPYAQLGPTLIAYYESRSDKTEILRGKSIGTTVNVGANFMLDFLTPKGSWDLYDGYGIKRYFLTINYGRLWTMSGDVDFQVNSISVGLTFEL